MPSLTTAHFPVPSAGTPWPPLEAKGSVLLALPGGAWQVQVDHLRIDADGAPKAYHLRLVAYKARTLGLMPRGAIEKNTLSPYESLQVGRQKACAVHDKVVAAKVPTLPWVNLEALITRWHRNPMGFIQAGLIERLPDDPKVRGRSARVM